MLSEDKVIFASEPCGGIYVSVSGVGEVADYIINIFAKPGINLVYSLVGGINSCVNVVTELL